MSEFDPSAFLDGDEVVASLTDLGALAEPIRIEDGHFTPPDRPGHGIVFDRATRAAHAVDADPAARRAAAFLEPIRECRDRSLWAIV